MPNLKNQEPKKKSQITSTKIQKSTKNQEEISNNKHQVPKKHPRIKFQREPPFQLFDLEFLIWNFFGSWFFLSEISFSEFLIRTSSLTLRTYFLFITFSAAATIYGVSRPYFFNKSFGVPLSPKVSLVPIYSIGMGK